MTTNFEALISANTNKIVTIEGQSYYIPGTVDEQQGALKTGEKAPYLVLINTENHEVTIKVHPQKALTLMKKGACDRMMITGDTYEVVAVKEKKERKARSVDPSSKKQRTIALVKAGWNEGMTRKQIIDIMKDQFGLSDAGASTYYQNVKSGMWS